MEIKICEHPWVYPLVIVLYLFLLFSFSCTPCKRAVISKSRIKLEGRNTSIRNLIEIDGYYRMPTNTGGYCRMFFEDGMWVYFAFKNGLSENEIRANMLRSVMGRKKKERFRWGSDWGVYQIQNDTIIVYRYTKGSFWEAREIHEERYKVVDRITIERIYYRKISKADDSYYKDPYHSPWINKEHYDFISADSLPSSDCWLKEEKWIWRKESDWKSYMAKLKKH